MNIGSSFYFNKELKNFKFKSIGKNVLIEKTASLYFIENFIGNKASIDDNVIIVVSKKILC